MRDRDQVLGIEDALFQKANPEADLKASSSPASGVGDERGQRAIPFEGPDAQYNAGPNLGG